MTGKTITQEVMAFFSDKKYTQDRDDLFKTRLSSAEVVNKLDGMASRPHSQLVMILIFVLLTMYV